MKTFKEFFVNSFFCYLAIELVEETLEELITIGLSSLLVKGVSTLLVVSCSQGVKITIKAFVKRLTYREGNDKVNKLKKFFLWINANKKTIAGTVSAAMTVGTGAVLSSGVEISKLAPLYIGTFNCTPLLFTLVLAVCAIIGVFGKGKETIEEYNTRKQLEKAQAEQKAIEKQAKKEIKAEEKAKNQSEAQKEKERIKQENEQKIKEEKERLANEHKAQVEAMKEKIKAQAEADAQANNNNNI